MSSHGDNATNTQRRTEINIDKIVVQYLLYVVTSDLLQLPFVVAEKLELICFKTLKRSVVIIICCFIMVICFDHLWSKGRIELGNPLASLR